MAMYTDSYSILKLEKSNYNQIKKDIFQLVQEVGSGAIDPVPYDTAWVARVPEANKSSNPAFPECLQWLRDHQNEDGSWDGGRPSSLHSTMLNTFASVLALWQWNYTKDENIKHKGICALMRLAENLRQKETDDSTFEMIMAGFLDDARELRLNLPSCAYFEWCFATGKKKQREIEHKIISDKPNKYWACLEASCRNLDLELESFRSEITQHGLIANQPSSTAYFLRYARLKGKVFPEAEWALATLCAKNKGGVPHFSRCNNFEIVHILDLLFKAGINPRNNIKHAVTNPLLRTLEKRYNYLEGIGFSSNWPIIDYECSKTALDVMESARTKDGIQNAIPNNEPEKGIARDSNLVYESEHISNETDSLKTYILHKKFDCKQQSVINETYSFRDEAFLCGRRNVSLYYAALQEIFKVQDFNSGAFTEFSLFFERNQNGDGGWGSQETSTVEETAYVCLAIFHLFQKDPEILKWINLPRIIQFMNNTSSPLNNESMWCYKVNFRSALVSKAAIFAAKYVLFQIQRLFLMTAAFNDSQGRFLDIKFWALKNQPLCHVYALLSASEMRPRDIDIKKQEIINVCKDILEVEDFDSHVQFVADVSLECIHFCHFNTISVYDRAFELTHLIGLVLADDVFDCYLVGKNDVEFLNDSNELLNIWSGCLKGDYVKFEDIPALGIPRFQLLKKCFFFLGKILREKGGNPESFFKLTKNWVMTHYALSYKLQRYNIKPSPKRYLEIGKGDIAVVEMAHIHALVDDNALDTTKFEHYKLFNKYRDCACKVARIFNDLGSTLRDVDLSSSDNYIILLQKQYHISLGEAMVKAIKKSNKEVLKMFCIKQAMLQDPEYKNNKKLLLCLKYLDYSTDGLFHFSLETPRYKSQGKLFSKQVQYEQKTLKFIWDICFKYV